MAASGGSADTNEEALRKLEEYGERFMAMFDDSDKDRSRKAKGGARHDQAKRKRSTGSRLQAEGLADGAGVPPASKDSAGWESKAEDNSSRVRGEQRPPTAGAGATTGSAPGQSEAAAGRKRKSSISEIDAIMRQTKRKKTKGSSGVQAGGAAGGQGSVSGAGQGGKAAGSGRQGAGGAERAAGASGAQQQSDYDAMMRRERKLFMSSKASKVHEAVGSGPARGRRQPRAATDPGSEVDPGLSPEEFQRLQMEVEKFASTALDKKSAKKYKARMLERLGAKADKGPRTAASIGKGMARVGAKREAKALEEAIEAGMVQRKGLGKKKRAEKAKNRDRGLMEAGPSFKNGVLRVKPIKKTNTNVGKLRLPKGF